jgi:hypothetical protein
MKKTLKLLLSLTLLSILHLHAQEYLQATKISQVNGEPYYILPKAVLKASIQVSKTTYKKTGNYKVYSDDQFKLLKRLYGVDKEIYNTLKGSTRKNDTATYVRYKILEDSIRISVLARPDFTKIFYTESRKRWNKNKSVTMTLGEDGIGMDGESFTEDKTTDLIIKGVSTLASVAGAFRGGSNNIAPNVSTIKISELDEILEAIENLNNSPSNFDIYKDLKAGLEKKYTRVFAEYFYSEVKQIKTTNALYEPAQGIQPNNSFAFFSFNESSGKIDFSDQLKGSFWASDIVLSTLPAKSYFINFISVADNIYPYIAASPQTPTGFAYNIPARFELKLSSPTKETIIDSFIKIPQLGILGYINSGKKKLSYSLDPITGELKKVTLSSTSIATEQIAAAGVSAIELIKMAKGDSQATKLDNEVKMLENQKKKRDLQKELEQ